MVIKRAAVYVWDLLMSTLRVMLTGLKGADSSHTDWVYLYVRGASERYVWFMSHMISMSPSTIAVIRSEDGDWLYVHTLFGTNEDMQGFRETSLYVYGLPTPPASGPGEGRG